MANTNVEYIDGEWWYTGQANGRRRLSAHKRKNDTRMFVDGVYIPKSHPLHKPGRYEGFEEAAFSSLTNYKSSSEGEVYIMTNPAYDGWVKVGMAVDARDRLKNYQTSSPFRDFELVMFTKFKDRRDAEAAIHRRLAQRFEQRNEWFKCSVEEARLEVIGYKEEKQ